MESYALCLCGVMVIVRLYKVLRLCRQSISSLPNGPSPVPILGNIWTVHMLNVSPGQTCLNLRRRYGDLATLWLGSWPVIFINGPQAAYELLQKVHTPLTLRCLEVCGR